MNDMQNTAFLTLLKLKYDSRVWAEYCCTLGYNCITSRKGSHLVTHR